MTQKTKGKNPEPAGQTFEDHLRQLEAIVQQLETGQMDLSESLKAFEAGVQHLRACHQRLHEAEEKISVVVDVDEDGTAKLKSFVDAPASEPGKSRSKRSSNRDTDSLF